MKKLNDYQKDFICDKFFTNEKYPGWKSIAMDLLNNGECVVAGNYCIWKGGIGNFIKVETASKYIGCVKYVFDLDVFISSKHFKEMFDLYVDYLENEIKRITNDYNDLKELQ